MKNLLVKTGGVILLTCVFILGFFGSHHTQASDRDTEPYLLYVDPVTGKYTTQKPGHVPANPIQNTEPGAEITGNTSPSETGFIPILVIIGGLLISSYLFATTLVKIKMR